MLFESYKCYKSSYISKLRNCQQKKEWPSLPKRWKFFCN